MSWITLLASLLTTNMFLSRLVPRAGLARVFFLRSTIPQRTWIPRASYAAGGGGLTREVITSRILETLKGYEKIDPAKVRVHNFQLD